MLIAVTFPALYTHTHTTIWSLFYLGSKRGEGGKVPTYYGIMEKELLGGQKKKKGGGVFEEAEGNRRYFELVTHTKLNPSLVSLKSIYKYRTFQTGNTKTSSNTLI